VPDPDKTLVKITDESNGNEYNLTFHLADSDKKLEDYYYEYNGIDLVIDYGKSYTLDVTTEVDGRRLSARSTTTVPNAGFSI
jgi:hypothetical protein